jgi:hydrogenase maturation factor
LGQLARGTLLSVDQTILDRTKRAAFFDEIVKWAVSDEEALDAAKLLTKPRGFRQHAEVGAITGTLAPAFQAAGRVTKAVVDAKQGRLGAARKALVDTTRGGLAQAVVGGGLTGSGLSFAREGLQVRAAKDTYRKFMEQRKGKAP